MMMVTKEVEDSEDSEDTVPTKGLSIALSSSTKWGKFAMDD
jgi:hypothetical protein